MAAEKQFENRVKAYLKSIGAWYVKFFANSYTKAGVPDILACINGKFVGIEVKAQNGIPSDLQIYQCELIKAAGGLAYILYPSGFQKFKDIIENNEKCDLLVLK